MIAEYFLGRKLKKATQKFEKWPQKITTNGHKIITTTKWPPSNNNNKLKMIFENDIQIKANK